MFDSITQPIGSAWQAFVEFFTVSSFWLEWLPLGAGIIALCLVVSYFFPAMRSFAGAVVLAVVAFLVGFRKGDKEATARSKKEIDRLKQQRQQQQGRQQWEWWR